MLKGLTIKFFKRFKTLDLKMSNLTVLTGANGAGKTSVIHALLVLRKAARLLNYQSVPLNDGDGLELGYALDVLNTNAEDNVVKLSIAEGDNYQWIFSISDNESDKALTVAERPENYAGILASTGSGFTYLCAERYGPRDVLTSSSERVENLNIGVHGEYCAQVLAEKSSHKIPLPFCFPNPDVPKLLLQQVEAWMAYVVRPVHIDANQIPGTLATRLRFKEPGATSGETRPTNMGFGVSYALPIIVAGLCSEPGALLIIENPEAHLHPAGQSRIGEFLARVAGGGCQVILETHSDHVINGIRRYAVTEDSTLDSDKTIIYYFDDQEVPSTISIKKTGQLSNWPKGFFDQAQKDLANLARMQRGAK